MNTKNHPPAQTPTPKAEPCVSGEAKPVPEKLARFFELMDRELPR